MIHRFLQRGETVASLILAVLIGIATGFAAIGFRLLINFFKTAFFSGGQQVFAYLDKYYVMLIPALGGLVVGPLTYFLAREAKGHGVPEVMAAVAEKGGVIRPRVVVVKSLASAVCIGSGGSVGREGPIVQIGSAVGSTVGQLFRVPTHRLRALVACGAAGGIAATFNAPIGGVLFALEVILGEFSGSHLVLVIVAAVMAAVIGRIFLGDIPAFAVPAYPLTSPWELILYVCLGIVAGAFGILYIKLLYKCEDWFDAIRNVPDYLKPAIGGLLVGAIGCFFPQVFGVGYESVEQALTGRLPVLLTATLLFMKLLATSLTIGSGGSGGVFAPSLFMGSMLGSTLGVLFHRLLPDIAQIPAAYALVGMGAVFAGCAQAPMTAIIMLFEMSNDYRIILPLMIACIISAAVARGLFPHSIYTMKLVRRGLDIDAARLRDVLKHIPVREVMTRRVETIPGHLSVKKAVRLVSKSRHQGFPVVDEHNRLTGIVTRYELYSALRREHGDRPVQSVASVNLILVTADESLSAAAGKLARFDIGRLPVVETLEDMCLVGIVTRSDILRAYGRTLQMRERPLVSAGAEGRAAQQDAARKLRDTGL